MSLLSLLSMGKRLFGPQGDFLLQNRTGIWEELAAKLSGDAFYNCNSVHSNSINMLMFSRYNNVYHNLFSIVTRVVP